MISKGASPNIADIIGNKPIDYLPYESDLYKLLGGVVASTNIFELVQYGSIEKFNSVISEIPISINLIDDVERPLLFYSAGNNPQPEMTKRLLELGADVNQPDLRGWTPLMYAVYQNINPEVLKVLVEAGAALETRNDEGMTALMIAVKSDRVDMAQELLSLGAELYIEESFDKRDALDYAAMSASVEMLKLLLASAEYINADKINKLLSFAVESNRRLDMVRYLIDLGGNVNYQMPLNWRGYPTLLHRTSMLGVLEKVELLLDYGANINAKNGNGNTPLMVALCSGQIETLNFLIDRGANIPMDDFETLKNENQSLWFFINPDGSYKMLTGECQ